MTITTNLKSSVHSTARLGVCALIGVAALAACGEVTENQASSSPAVAPAASTLASSAAFDKQASLDLASDHAMEARVVPETVYLSAADGILALPSTVYVSAADARIEQDFGYESPEAQDKQAMIEVAANHALNG